MIMSVVYFCHPLQVKTSPLSFLNAGVLLQVLNALCVEATYVILYNFLETRETFLMHNLSVKAKDMLKLL